MATGRPTESRIRHPMLVASRHPALIGSAAALTGVLATAVGAGVGTRHLQKVGLSVASVTGLLLLLIGLALLAFAAVVGWCALHRWGRLWLVPIGLLCLVVISSLAQAVMFTQVPRNALGSVTPADRGLAYTDVAFPATDGVGLAAWLVPSKNRAAVVVLHGAGENRTATLSQAVVLARHGFGVLMLDARGQGQSGGDGMEVGWYGDADVGGALGFLRQRADVDPNRIAVLGLSMGGEEAILPTRRAGCRAASTAPSSGGSTGSPTE